MGTKNLRIEARQPQPVVCAQAAVSDVGVAFPRLLGAVFAWLGKEGGRAIGPPFVRFLEMSAGTYRVEVGIPTESPMASSGEITASELPGGEIAIADHFGPYNTLVETSAALRDYVASEGRSAAGPMWESYITDPSTVSEPADLLTEVCMPLK